MKSLVLASGSAIRRSLLSNAGLTFEVQTPRLDEDAIKSSLKAEGAKPRDIADALAEAKATKISGKTSGSLVIGADQMLEIKGELLSKPIDITAARAQLRRLSGKTHVLHSAAVLVEDGTPIWRHVSTARLTMREFSDSFLEQYLRDAGEDILGSVGAYKFEAEGVRLFSKVEGSFHAILGLPLIELVNFLSASGHFET